MTLLLPLLFSPVQLTALCSLWKIAWQVPQIISHSLPRKKPVLCSYVPRFLPLCTFSISSATGVQKYFTLWYHSSKCSGQQEEYAGKHHDEKGAKAHSAWSRITSNRLQTFYDELNLSARYSTARIDRSSSVFSLVSSLVFFSHSALIFSSRNSVDCTVECHWVP